MGNLHLQPLNIYKTKNHPPDTEFTVKKEREINGQCPDCGIQTYIIKHSVFGGKVKIPITSGEIVINGRCLDCKPL
jgi:ssDNA-binding Zn-finger/Zn-ribbon topoisomerase 1